MPDVSRPQPARLRAAHEGIATGQAAWLSPAMVASGADHRVVRALNRLLDVDPYPDPTVVYGSLRQLGEYGDLPRRVRARPVVRRVLGPAA